MGVGGEGPVLQGRRARISDRPAGRANRGDRTHLGDLIVASFFGTAVVGCTFIIQYYYRPESRGGHYHTMREH